MFLGKLRNRRSKEDKEDTNNNAAKAAAYQRINNQGTRLGQTDIIIPKKKDKKQYTQREWNRFGTNQQDILSNRYEVTIPDHETRNEKIKRNAKKINLKNFDKGMQKFGDAQDQFWKEWDKGMTDAGMGKKKQTSIYGEKSSTNNTNRIYGKPSKKSNKKKVRIF